MDDGALLAPQAAVVQLMGPKHQAIEWQELYALKVEFGLSMAESMDAAAHP